MKASLKLPDHQKPSGLRNTDEHGVASGQLHTATVKAFLTEREARVETETGETIHARQAASCLLAPVIGDRVLVYAAGEDSHILAVLERPAGLAAEISVPDADHVTLRSAKRLELAAPVMTLAAREMNLVARAVSHTGDMLAQSFRRIVETVTDKVVGARTITTKAETRTSIVKEVETLNVGTLMQNVEHVATQNSDISLVTARQDVRLDAKRVSVG